MSHTIWAINIFKSILSCMVGNVPKQIPDNHLEKFCKIINKGPGEFCDDIKKFRRQLVCQYEAHHIGKYKKVQIFTKKELW